MRLRREGEKEREKKGEERESFIVPRGTREG